MADLSIQEPLIIENRPDELAGEQVKSIRTTLLSNAETRLETAL